MRLFLTSLKYWFSHILLIGFIIIVIALLTGFCEAWLWQNYVLQQNDFPLLDYLFSSTYDSIVFIVTVLKIILWIWGGSSIIYIIHLSFRANSNKFIPSLQAGMGKWFRIFCLIVSAACIAWVPYWSGIYTSPGILWGIAVTLYFILKYPLSLPVLVVENETITVSLRKGAKLSRGIRAEILLLVFSFFMLSEAVCMGLYFLLPAPGEMHGIFALALASSTTYFIRWLLYSPILIALYVCYREQLSYYLSYYLAA